MSTLNRPLLGTLMLAGTLGIAHAQGFYAGANIGAPDWHDSVNGVGEESGGGAGKLYGGYSFTPNFALEAGAMHLGHTSDDSGEAKGYGGYVDAVGSLPIAKDWSLIGRVGAADAHFTTLGESDNGVGLKLGAGVQYDLTSNVALRAEYEHYHFRDVFDGSPNVGQVTAGVKVNF